MKARKNMHPAVYQLGCLAALYSLWWRQPFGYGPHPLGDAALALLNHSVRRVVDEPNEDNSWPRQ